jgi:hypothetical protein
MEEEWAQLALRYQNDVSIPFISNYKRKEHNPSLVL